MAFFVPVVRNGKWDIYPTRVRTTSTGSNSSSGNSSGSGGNSLSTSPATAAQTGGEARKVRFSRSMSQDGGAGAMYRMRSSRSSSDCGPTLSLSPTLATPNVMPRTGSLRGLRRSTGQLGTAGRKEGPACQNAATKMCSSTPPPNAANQLAGSRGSVTKFHTKLVDKIKRKLRIKDDNGEGASEDETGAVVRAST